MKKKPDLSIDFCGIKSPNPFWLASAPPSNSGYQVQKAFEDGWGGAVWKTIGAPVLNVCNRYGTMDYKGSKIIGLNNVELISDRPIEVNLREMAEVKRNFPNHAVIASIMVESKKEAWQEIVKRTEETGIDGFELNFGCPHGMSERGMGSAMGQVPEYTCMVTEWVMEVATKPVIVKLTPNVTDIVQPARAALKAKCDALSLINTINSIMGVDLDTFELRPNVGGKGGHGGYAGPAVKPIALHLLSAVGSDPEVMASKVPISGIGGVETWQDAVEFMLLGSTSVQVCTAVMHWGFRIVEDMVDGLSNWMEEKGFEKCTDFIGKSLPRISNFGDFDLGFQTVARINHDKCVQCNLCFIACNDAAHQCIDLKELKLKDEVNERLWPVVREKDCVGCDLCSVVCPVDDCISMVEVDGGRPHITWNELTKSRPEVLEWDKMEQYRKEANIHIH
ncbi:MAG: NAD-dependent dihydropyrimidine dehydrogenase subunit PreA [Candidatus Melainabacteria bacterium]|nr:MAG: NAD-dependent dihydropyrimidine dehydrogenase subunit PreA [Candidatus Melainabacteria bacterium]